MLFTGVKDFPEVECMMKVFIGFATLLSTSQKKTVRHFFFLFEGLERIKTIEDPEKGI